jgi:endonuclease/exonuclease/phosphatase (EEP) superfamily protein YafD
MLWQPLLALAEVKLSSPLENAVIAISQSCGSPEAVVTLDKNISIAEDVGLDFPLRLLNWNIEKTTNEGWQQDLAVYSKGFSLVLLQEAASNTELNRVLTQFSSLSMAPGYHTGDVQTGVLTASSYPAIRHCYLQHKEPWLRSVKTAQLSWYPMKNSRESLLVVNVHSVNFTLGIDDYEQQLQAFTHIAEQHDGPIIIGGDFNTWNDKRIGILQQLAKNLELVPVKFLDDKRTQAFGHVIDHIYTRGFIHQASYTQSTDSSDHNPLFAELNIVKPEQIKVASVQK